MPDSLSTIFIKTAISVALGLKKVEKQLPKVEKHDPTLLYKYKNTTLVQPEVRFGVLPPQETNKKLVNRYVYKYGLRELKEFVKAQYWKIVDFVSGVPGLPNLKGFCRNCVGLVQQKEKLVIHMITLPSSNLSIYPSSNEIFRNFLRNNASNIFIL